MEFKILRSILGDLDPIVYNSKEYKPIFGYGSHADLLKFLRLKRKENVMVKYPIVWVETPVLFKYRLPFASGDMKIVIATLSNKDMSNIQRTDTTFALVLNPTLENAISALKRNQATSLVPSNEYDLTKYFNYDSDDEHEATDIWDAIKYEFKLNINTNCKIL